MISETMLNAIIGCGGAITGGAITAAVNLARAKQTHDIKNSDLLIEAQRQLAETIADSQRLWAWNRQLVDHIWRRAPPPPPDPPQDLFHHD